MGVCMLSKSTQQNPSATTLEPSVSIRSRIRIQFEHQSLRESLGASTGTLQKTGPKDIQVKNKSIEEEEASLPRREMMELKVPTSEGQENSAQFQVKGGSTLIELSNEDLQIGSQGNIMGKVEIDPSYQSQFSFQMNALKPVCEGASPMLSKVIDQRHRELILGTMGKEEPISIEKIVFNDGETYEGQWLAAKRHGKGRHTSSAGIYVGQWVNDNRNGYGIFLLANKSRYEGEWVDGKMEGKGRLEESSGSTYQGQFRWGCKEGFGKETYGQGEYYQGQWKDGYKHGQGHLQFSDGSYCKGNFYQNCIHGQAEYYWAGQKRYCGEWVLNKMEGDGVMEWQDGRKYEGGYSNDKMWGRGVFRYPNGSFFTGKWRNNRKNGRGVYTDEHGNTTKGVWYEDRLIDEYVNVATIKRSGFTSTATIASIKN